MISILLAGIIFGAAPPAVPWVPERPNVRTSERPVSADTVRLVVVATTDVHAQATGWDYALERPFAGGLTRVATVVDSLRRVHGDRVVLVDAGDLLQGNPLGEYLAREPRDPHPIIGLMNAMGYDAATPGNHDFDFGVPFLRRAAAAATFKYVSGNVQALPADTLMFPAFVTVRHGGLRVAITGFTTPGVNLWDRAQLRGAARVLPLGQAAPPVLAAMRRSGDVSIVLSHSGFSGGSTYEVAGVGAENEAAVLAQGPDAPDLVVVGHTHREVRDTVIGRTHFTQPKFHAQSVSVTHILLEQLPSGRWKVQRVVPDIIPVGETEESRRVSGRMAAAHDDATRWLTQPIGRASAPFGGQFGRVEPTPLVNFIHSVQRARTGAQLSATPLFRPEAGFAQGEIRRGNVAAVYPYENTLMAIRVTGAQLRAYLEQSARYWALTPDGRLGVDRQVAGYNFDMVSGAEYEIDPSRPVGSRIRNLSVRGRAVEPSDTFSLALNSYRASGAGGYTAIAGAPILYDKGENVRQLLAQAVEQRQVLNPADFGENNWRLVPEAVHQQGRVLFGAAPTGVAAAAAAPVPVAGRSRPVVRVLAINDLHGALLPRAWPWSAGREVGGVATLDAMMDSAAAECRCPTIRLSAGDEMQGTLESNLVHGKSTVAALNQMKVAAAALGNHEFDWGQDTLRARMRDARFPWLSANIFDSATGQRPEWVAPWQLFQLDTLRVAVVGYTHSGTKGIVMPENVAGLTFGRGASAIGDVLETVKASRPHLTILVAHEGGFCDSTPACHGEIFDLARELPPGSVNAIVAGHTHSLLDTEVNGIPIIEARSSGTALGVLDLTRRPDGTWAGAGEVRPAYVDQVRPDSVLAEMVYQVRRQTEPLARRRIASLAQPLLKTSDDETTIGNFIADAQRNALRADAAIMNSGGVRTSLSSGDVTYEQLFALQPFGNRIYAVTLTGKELRAALEVALQDGRPDASISGITVKWDPRRPAGQRVREVTFLDRKKVKDKERYTVAVNAYIAAGGSGFAPLVGKPRAEQAFGDVEVVELWLKRQPQPVRPPALGRWQRAQ